MLTNFNHYINKACGVNRFSDSWFTVYAVLTRQKSTLFDLDVTPNMLTTVMALFTLTITHN